jgi:hypothetical protein
MVNPSKSYFVQDNIVKDRAVFLGDEIKGSH